MMNNFRIIGESKPNKVKLKIEDLNKVIEMSKRKARILVETGRLSVVNPELLYHKI